MPPKKYDWETEIRVFIALKAKRPTLTHEEFYRIRGLNSSRARKKIGRKLGTAWEQVQKVADVKAKQEAGLDLAATLVHVVKGHRAQFDLGVQGLFDKSGKPKATPKSAAEASAMMRDGGRGVVSAASVLTGRDPLTTPEGGSDVFRMNRPSKRRRQPAKKRRKKPKPKAKGKPKKPSRTRFSKKKP